MPEWESVELPRGSFIGWGNTPGQHVTGSVLSYSPTGGKNTKGEDVPELTVELTEPAASFNKFGERKDFAVGDLVTLTCSQTNLKRNILAADLSNGDLVKVTLEKLVPAGEGTAKLYDVKFARGAGKASRPAPAAAPAAPAFDSEPPF
ncbi:hypothetical protein JRC04_05360 [Mycolicibacterium sp. S2-37]|uniref:hypothetical protein n=1 Tax=Mycolicibacterium sp. S2-37 TaxID=2810297 RepID=UPI001A943572|nr:hypothetical protein [Mycolicibacterium sp. S2-37]MBO0676883.1 hypothetical protein [Mycolicibacterium sp. S2-37]